MEVLSKMQKTVSCTFCGGKYVIFANEEDMKIAIVCPHPHCGKHYTVNFRTGRITKGNPLGADEDVASWPKLKCPSNKCNGFLQGQFIATGKISVVCWKCGRPYIADLDTGRTWLYKKTN